MNKIFCITALISGFSVQGAASSLPKLLAARLVDNEGIVTQPIVELLEATQVESTDFTLASVVEATQKSWVRADWKFSDRDVKGVDIASTRELIDGLFVERAGDTAPRVLCQGGGLTTMVQTFAAACNIVHEFPSDAADITCYYRDMNQLAENTLDDYEALLRVFGLDPDFKTVPKTQEELTAFLQHHLYKQQLSDLKITLLPVADRVLTDAWAKENSGKSFCVAAAPLQAATGVQSLQASFPDITITGVETVGKRGAEICEPLYKQTSSPAQQLSVRLSHIGRELFYINKNRSRSGQ